MRGALRGQDHARQEATLRPQEGGAQQPPLTLTELRAFAVRRNALQAQMDAAPDAAAARTTREQLRALDAPMLPRLRALLQATGDRSILDGAENRELRDMAVRMLQEASVASGELAMRADAAGNTGPGAYDYNQHVGQREWCGLFTGAMMARGGGLDPDLRGAFSHERGVEAFYTYSGRAGTRNYVQNEAGQFVRVHDFHTQRGSERSWIGVDQMHAPHADLDIRPGDTVLLNTIAGERGDHIAQVHTYHRASGRLTTIDGNGGGFVLGRNEAREGGGAGNSGGAGGGGGRGGAREQSRHEAGADLGADVRAGPANRPGAGGGHIGINSYAMDRRRGDYFFVHGRGRASLVDYENHVYAAAPPRGGAGGAGGSGGAGRGDGARSSGSRPPRNVSRNP